MNDEIDAEAYLRRVGVPAEGSTPTVAMLRRLHRAHVDAIPFTSVTTALGRVPALDLPTLERRMVAERRGGYCLEHVTLFAAVLEALGFGTDVRLCQVGDPAQVDEGRPPTHLTVLARPIDDARRWMADVGFGVGVLGPVPVPQAQGEGEPVRYGGWEHRADASGDGRILLLERDAGRAGGRCTRRSTATSTHGRSTRRTGGWRSSQDRRSPAGSSRCGRRTSLRERLVGTRLERVPAPTAMRPPSI